MSVSVWKRNKNYHIEFQTPGFGRGRFSISSRTGRKSTAVAYGQDLHTLYTEGKFRVLELVQQNVISLATLKQQMEEGGVKGVLAFVEDLERKQKEAASQLTVLLQQFINDPNRKASDTTYRNYATQISWFVRWREEQLNSADPPEGSRKRKKERIAELSPQRSTSRVTPYPSGSGSWKKPPRSATPTSEAGSREP